MGNESYIYESEIKLPSIVWMFQNIYEYKPTKVVKSRNVPKKVIAFFLEKRTILQLLLQTLENRTVDTDWYTLICLPEVIGGNNVNQRSHSTTPSDNIKLLIRA